MSGTATPRRDNLPMDQLARLPVGTVTFLFTDIEGSTKLLNMLGTDRFGDVLAVHTTLLRDAFADGVEVRVEGDSLFMVFASAPKAVAGAVAAQRAIAGATFPHDAVVRVRMGMHTGEGRLASPDAGPDYIGIDVHRAARIAAVGYGGQVLLSASTATLVAQDLGAGVGLRDLGAHRLKDLAQPERIHQLVIDGLPNDFPPVRTLERTPNNLPIQSTSFVGREKEIADGLRLLGKTRLLTLTGPGGTGKTRLSLQLAAEASDGYPDGAFWVPLAPISDPDLVPSTIAHSIGVQVSGGEAPLDRLTEYVRDRRLLLVLDNFEQILPAAAAVSALLESGQHLKVLASSRAPLRISGEQELPVPPLDLPDPARLPSLEVLAQSDAVRLFVERATAVRPDFAVTAENAAAVAEICYRLDGLPLAIELAAARVKLLTPQAMLPRLKQGLDLLAGGARDRTDRQRTLRGAIAWSYDLLDHGLRRLFARCGVFVGGAMLDELEPVCGPAGEIGRDILDGLAELVDQSLMRQSEVDGEPRFRMLVTIRDFAMERLEATAEAGQIRLRHADAYIALAEAAALHFQGPDQKRWLDRVELEHDNMRAALECAIGNGRVGDASRLLFALWRFWQSRGHLREGQAWAERVLVLPGATPADRLRALEAAGGLAYWAGDPRMLTYYTGAYEVATASGDRRERAKAAYDLAFVYFIGAIAQDFPRARSLLEESVAGYREVGDPGDIGRAAWALATLLQMGRPPREQVEQARAYAREALDRHAALGNRFDIAYDLHLLGLTALKLGELDEAAARFDEALGMFVEAADSSGIVLALSNFAELAKARGDLERHATLVGAWSALAGRTGVGVATTLGTVDNRATEKDIPAELHAALARGLGLSTEAAVAYALEALTR